jgi:hypothetical protein
VTEPGDIERDFEARKLSSLSRLCALRHLDLELDGIGEVIGRDSEST